MGSQSHTPAVTGAPTAHTQLGFENLVFKDLSSLNKKPPRDVTMVTLLTGNKRERGFVSYPLLGKKTSFSLI